MQQTDVTNKRKTIISLISVIGVGVIAYLATQIFFNPQPADKKLMQIEKDMQKTFPIMIDQNVRLDDAAALPENSFQLNFTLLKLDKSEINLDSIKKYIEECSIVKIKTNPDLKKYLNDITKMNYLFKDKNGEFVFRIDVTTDMYKIN